MEEFSEVLKNIFRSEIEDDVAEETKKDLLTGDAAGIYVVCAEDPDIQKFMRENNAENFTDPGSLRNIIQEYLAEVTYHELAGEVFDILDNTRLCEVLK